MRTLGKNRRGFLILRERSWTGWLWARISREKSWTAWLGTRISREKGWTGWLGCVILEKTLDWMAGTRISRENPGLQGWGAYLSMQKVGLRGSCA